MSWNTEGLKIQPLAGTILADSGPRNSGKEKYTVIVWNDQDGGLLEIAIRSIHPHNHNNCDHDHPDDMDGTVQRLQFGPITTVFEMPVTLNQWQRVVVRMQTDFFGQIQASLLS